MKHVTPHQIDGSPGNFVLSNLITCVMQGIARTLAPKGCPYESYFIWGYYGTKYRVRFYPPFGYSILYKEYYLTRFNHQKKRCSYEYSGGPLSSIEILRLIVGRLARAGSARVKSGFLNFALVVIHP